MKKLFIYCAGGVGKEVCDIAERMNSINRQWNTIRFIDDVRKENSFYGHDLDPYIVFKEKFSPDESEIVIANGEPINRKIIREKILTDDYRLSRVVDPTSVISTKAVLMEGVVIYPFVCISGSTTIGQNTLLYHHASVAHDSSIGMDSVLSINAIIAGNCKIGQGCFIGAGATIRESVTVGEWTIVSMESAVYKTLDSFSIYKGNPAQWIRKNDEFIVFKKKSIK